MKVKDQIVFNQPREDYDAIDAMNFSRLKYMDRSPLMFRYNCENPKEQTDAMLVGNASHTSILEPKKLDYAVFEGKVRNGNAWDTFRLVNQGKTLLTKSQADFVKGITEAARGHRGAMKYLRYGRQSEMTMVWNDPQLGRAMKGRLDLLAQVDGEEVQVSVKTCADCRPHIFGAQYFKMAYYAQDALYQSGYFYICGSLPRVVVIAIEQKPPHEIAVYRVPTDILRLGQQKLGEWVRKLSECEKSGKWPGAVEDEPDIELPSYAYPEGDFDFDDLIPIEK